MEHQSIQQLQQRYEKLKQQIAQYDHRGDYVGLAGSMEEFLQLTGEIYGIDSLEYATTLNDYAGIHRDIGNYSQAEQGFLQAAALVGRKLGEQHPDYGSVLNNLAGLYRLMGQYEQALSCFGRVVDLYAATLGTGHFLYISGLNNMGLVYQDLKQFEKAVQLHRQSLVMLEAANDNPIAIGTTLTNLASAQRKLGQLEDVESLLLRALRIYEETLGNGHSLYAYGLNNLASYYYDCQAYDKAVVYYQSALDICRTQFGEQSRNYQVAQRNYQLALQKLEEQKNEAAGQA